MRGSWAGAGRAALRVEPENAKGVRVRGWAFGVEAPRIRHPMEGAPRSAPGSPPQSHSINHINHTTHLPTQQPAAPPIRPPQFLFRRAKALSLKGDYEDAEAALAAAEKADASLAADVEKERAANRQRLRAAEEKQRKGFGGFFKK